MNSSEFFTTPTTSSSYSNFVLLHESGFNTLYSVEREGKRFVVKALKRQHRGDLLYESLLRKEFEIGYSLEHPNICKTLSFEQFPEVGNAIILEWLDGRTLEQYMTEEGHRKEEIKQIVVQLCQALGYAHKRQTIHRDLKPQNIIITHNGDNIKLLDFGLSDTDYHTTLKEPAGSRRYAAPELQRGERVDSRSDIYSLGVIIDELFEGQRSRKISKIVSRATAYYPAERYPNAGSIATLLENRSSGAIYVIMLMIIATIGYLFFQINNTTKLSIESLIPSAQSDGVSAQEFERRQALCNDFYREINNSYLYLMNDQVHGVYKVSCADPELPNFDELSRIQLSHYKVMLDSMLHDIKKSSLYLNAYRNMASHNNELFTLMQNQFPTMFWLNTEQLYKSATDSLALKLKGLAEPQTATNYSELSHQEQQVENKRYQEAVQTYKRKTVKTWAVEYRKQHRLDALPDELLD
ncbi:MAG: serine/threonine-protein kinase [Rikenellaceae bacterium]